MLAVYSRLAVECTCVMRAAAKVTQNQAKKEIALEIPDARRLHGARRELARAMRVKKRPIR